MSRQTQKAAFAALFPMISGADGDAWARHAHPVSVWSRIALGLPLLILSGWSRIWIGPGWIAALAAAALFLWLNPRMMPRPASTDNWGAQATIGERLWLGMNRDEVPPEHRLLPFLLLSGSAVGHAGALYGVIVLDIWPTLLGYVTGMLCKLWYLDRMVWLARDVQGRKA